MGIPPAADNLAPPVRPLASCAGRPVMRTTWYCLGLACLAAVLMFWELGADALTGDEAQYALVVQNIKRSGDWLHVSPYPPTPYLQKPPLYFWLTAATYDMLGGPGEFAYRAWSAAAGVGAVVLTCVLGAMLLGPELGALAGLLLLTNRAFLLLHGARSGTFDAVVTLFAVAAAVVYWRWARGRFPWLAWTAIGVIGGLASMTKPFVGVPIVALLAVQALVAGRTSPYRVRLAGPLLALVMLAAVTAPWCLAQWQKYPKDFVPEFFGRNMVDRALHGVDVKHVEDWKFYLEQITKSSLPFLPVIPATLYAAHAWARGPRREEHALLVILAAGWVLLFSFSASKAVHYIYPAFPFFAVILASGVERLWRAVAGRKAAAPGKRTAAVVGGVVLAGFGFQYARTLYAAIPADRSPYVPWEMYQRLAPAMRAGDAQVVFYGFPDLQVHWRDQMRLRARDCYYLEQMRPGAVWLKQPGELATVLHAKKPSLLILSRLTDVANLLDHSNLPQRMDDRFTYDHHAFLIGGVDLEPLLEPRLHPPATTGYLRLGRDGAGTSFQLSVAPPIVAPARLTVRLRLPPGTPADPIRYVFTSRAADGDSKTLEDSTARPVGDVLSVSSMIEQERWAGQTALDVLLTLRSEARPDAVVSLTVDEVRLTMLPHIPPDVHPRR